ncbi:MAG: hypothetical protein E5V33_11665, partial [Mesorhizobium sp.]
MKMEIRRLAASDDALVMAVPNGRPGEPHGLAEVTPAPAAPPAMPSPRPSVFRPSPPATHAPAS